MTDSIADILGTRGFNEPPEIQLIKKFVEAEIQEIPQVRVTAESYIVTVKSGSAAATLRYKLFQLQRSLGHKKKIIIRVG